ncbi:MAG TPA: macro domain-containing protein, partial [Gemmatimonadaceae bacterium]|nr:macro domain-containing protein [Gemmatimonadaceae bacterium]
RESSGEGAGPAPGAARVSVRIDDLSFFDGTAIARPVTAALAATTPLLRRLEVAGGERLAKQLRLSEPLPVGSAVVTGAGALGVELMIHAVVMSDTERVSRDSVRRAVQSTLHRAADWQIAELGMPPFGLGAGNLDPDESADAMVDAMLPLLERARYPERVTVIVENADEERAFVARLAGWAARRSSGAQRAI